MAYRRDLDTWQLFLLAMVMIGGGVWLVIQDKSELRGLGGTMIGAVIARHFINPRDGDGDGGIGVGDGAGDGDTRRRKRRKRLMPMVAANAIRCSIVAVCALLAGWSPLLMGGHSGVLAVASSLWLGLCLGLISLVMDGRSPRIPG